MTWWVITTLTLVGSVMLDVCYIANSVVVLPVKIPATKVSAVIVSSASKCPSVQPFSAVTICNNVGSSIFECSIVPLKPGAFTLCLCKDQACDSLQSHTVQVVFSFLVRPQQRSSDVVMISSSTPTALSASSSTILTGHSDGSLQIRSATNGEFQWTGWHNMTISNSLVTLVKFSPTGEYFVSTGVDLRLVLWSINGSAISEIRQLYEITSVTWDGDDFIVGTAGGLLEIYNTGTIPLQPVTQILVGCGVTFIACEGSDFIVSCSNGLVSKWSREIRIMSSDSGNAIVHVAAVQGGLVTADVAGNVCIASSCWVVPGGLLSGAVSADKNRFAIRSTKQVKIYNIKDEGRWINVTATSFSVVNGVRVVNVDGSVTLSSLSGVIDATLEVQYSFTRIAGSFKSSLTSSATVSEWSDGSRLRWVLVGVDSYPVSGCVSVSAPVMISAVACRESCITRSCNVIKLRLTGAGNFGGCDLLRCDAIILNPVTPSSEKIELWRVEETTGPFLAFGSKRQIVYSGIGGAFDMRVEPSNVLRWQLSNRNDFTLSDFNISVYVPEPAPVAVFNVSLVSAGDAFLPASDIGFGDGFIAAASSSDIVVFDIRSLSFTVEPLIVTAWSRSTITLNGPRAADSVWLAKDSGCLDVVEAKAVYSLDKWVMSIEATPGVIYVCRCSSSCCPAGTSAVGLVQIVGPARRNVQWFCRVGYDCHIAIVGVGLTGNDSIVLAQGSSCASPIVQWYRAKGGEYIVPGTFTPGSNFTVCWCSSYSGCTSNADFSVVAGSVLFTSYQLVSGGICYIGLSCMVIVSDSSDPKARGDKIVLKAGSCSALTYVGHAQCQDSTCDKFDFGIISRVVPEGSYAACLCRASLSSCYAANDYTIDTGITLQVHSFPSGCADEFTGWRMPWQTTVDCCCNYKEAGSSPGCEDPRSSVWSTCNNQNNLLS